MGEVVPTQAGSGSVFKVNGAPEASDERGNLTIDFGFVHNNAPAPGQTVHDPTIVKLVDPSLALPGDTVTFTITATNSGNVVSNNVIVTDPVPGQLQIINVDASQGSHSISGNTVTFNLGTLQPNQVATMHIQAKLRPDVKPPVDITNTSVLSIDGLTKDGSATVHVTNGDLPATGEHPDDPPSSLQVVPAVAGLLIALGGLVTVIGWRKRQAAGRE